MHWDDHITGMITSLGWTTGALTAATPTMAASNKEEEEEEDVPSAPLTATSLWACPTRLILPSAGLFHFRARWPGRPHVLWRVHLPLLLCDDEVDPFLDVSAALLEPFRILQ